MFVNNYGARTVFLDLCKPTYNKPANHVPSDAVHTPKGSRLLSNAI